ncbi:hypothetical protein OG342_14955 [Streptomyces bobili]|nr:hypothetical protein [Streptomyces bobili]MCX5524154.1 hypothetical protein [Streptomyces bobili]
MAKKKNKAHKRLKAERKPTEKWTGEQQPYAVADAMWHAFMNALVRDGRH